MSVTKILKTVSDIKSGVKLYGSPVSAGFPSPADDFIDTNLDLNEHLVKHPASTFFVRASGDSMLGAGIHTGDILVVDRSLEAKNNSVVIVVLDGELTVKRFNRKNGRIFLLPENKSYKAIDVTDNETFSIWGVVTYVIHKIE